MTVTALAPTPDSPRRRHASREEYAAWVRATFAGSRGTISTRLWFYDRFVKLWPDLDEWFAAPLLTRLDLDADTPPEPGKRYGPSHEAGSYLAYLSLTHRLPMDAGWVLARNFDSLFNPRVAPGLGMDLDAVDALDRRQRQLGYRNGRTALTWAIARLVLWKGDPEIGAVGYEDLTAFADEIRRWCALPEARIVRTAHVHRTRRNHDPSVLVTEFEKACLTRLHVLHVLLFNTGRIAQTPFRGPRTGEVWREELTPPDLPTPLTAPVDRWLSGRLQSTDRATSVRHARDAFRYFLRWLAKTHPELACLDELTRTHVEGFLAHLHEHVNERTGRPLSARTRYTYISPLLQFFRETSQWGWSDVPARPLLGRSDMPKLPMRLPRFIPRDELDRLMEAVEELTDPHQRAAMLLLRWSGARRGEIMRLAIDCLDAYPDGYPRLRIPVGKTYTERMIPLHPQAADALRVLIDAAKDGNAAARHDAWAQQAVRYVFMRRGMPMGKHFLFKDALEIACTKAGLVDGDGRPTVTAHRFRHTVGTQLAEGGAQIQTIMAILGHRNAQMSATYSHISDPVLKEQYERVIAAGGRIAGPAAQTLLSLTIGEDTLDWLKTNFFKSELELGHCLRAPAEGPCECDLYLRCSKFLTTSEYAPRPRARLARERQLAQDAVERGWPREVERHHAIADRIRGLLTDLDESTEPGPDDHC
ncbi:tyrosine-type recombinase/integrase [Embleya scabrispora]|uniref:tyrosine-type recombinase/integrase n=1 Tax=Embleya scabrispora TaxID=159449 RepID=UPI000373EEF1|nr:tyrosine-type recombinase/integrase [Embleya scabrispora]MYS85451.1 tyrosine-type recombinase/integrase [Streptomyces sp. SID5474]